MLNHHNYRPVNIEDELESNHRQDLLDALDADPPNQELINQRRLKLAQHLGIQSVRQV
jgi:hypothetical protein